MPHPGLLPRLRAQPSNRPVPLSLDNRTHVLAKSTGPANLPSSHLAPVSQQRNLADPASQKTVQVFLPPGPVRPIGQRFSPKTVLRYSPLVQSNPRTVQDNLRLAPGSPRLAPTNPLPNFRPGLFSRKCGRRNPKPDQLRRSSVLPSLRADPFSQRCGQLNRNRSHAQLNRSRSIVHNHSPVLLPALRL